MIGRRSIFGESLSGVKIQIDKLFRICDIHIPLNSTSKSEEEVKKLRNRFLWKFQGRQINDYNVGDQAITFIEKAFDNEI